MISCNLLSKNFGSLIMIEDRGKLLDTNSIFFSLLGLLILDSVGSIFVDWYIFDEIFTSFVLIKVVVSYFSIILNKFLYFFDHTLFDSQLCIFISFGSLTEKLFDFGICR